jgi:heme/copper-type cytochrome/quinol oxidase subunit 2
MIWSFVLTALGWLLAVIVLLAAVLVLAVIAITVVYTVRYLRRPAERTTTILSSKGTK